MAFAHNPYGDGQACQRIGQVLLGEEASLSSAPAALNSKIRAGVGPGNFGYRDPTAANPLPLHAA